MGTVEERLAALEYLAAAQMAVEMKNRMDVLKVSRAEAIAESGAPISEPSYVAVEVIKKRAIEVLDVMIRNAAR